MPKVLETGNYKRVDFLFFWDKDDKTVDPVSAHPLHAHICESLKKHSLTCSLQRVAGVQKGGESREKGVSLKCSGFSTPPLLFFAL